jgi:lysophospholipase L1-like esterase
MFTAGLRSPILSAEFVAPVARLRGRQKGSHSSWEVDTRTMRIRLKCLAILVAACGVVALGQKPVTVHMAGDSTMAPKTERSRPETGWGEPFGEFLDPGKFAIDNRAVNGRSAKSFIAEGRWQALLDATKPGDWVFVQFGHNDEKETSADPNAPLADFRRNLQRFVTDVRAKGATPVLLTPVMRRRYDANGDFFDTHGEYPGVVRQVAKELDADLIDLHAMTGDLLRQRGPEASRSLFLMLKPGEHPNYPDGVEDNTHFSPKGARAVAQLAAGPFLEIVAKRTGGTR